MDWFATQLTKSNWNDFLSEYRHDLEPQEPIELNLTDNGSRIVVFPQFRHPFSSPYKDELRSGKTNSAYVMLENAKLRGDLTGYLDGPKKKIISVASSGCQATAAAIWGIRNDYPVIAFSPSKVPLATTKILTALGADVVWLPSNDEEICPRWWYVRMARDFERKNESVNYHLDQMISAQNPIGQAKILGPQIFDSDQQLDAVFLTVGTGGCLNALELYKAFNGCIKTKISPFQNPKDYYVPGPAHFVGKDCPWRPELDTPLIRSHVSDELEDSIPIITNEETFATGLEVFDRYDELNFGPSTWMALHPAIEYGKEHPGSVIGVIGMDSDFRYPEWLKAIYGDEIPEPRQKGTPPSFRERILKHRPELEGPLERMGEYTKRYPLLDERIEMIKRTYKPKREGTLHDLSCSVDPIKLEVEIRKLFHERVMEFS